MRKRKEVIFVLIVLLIIGTGIGYAKIDSINGNWGFISVRRNRPYYDLMGYTEDTAYYNSEIKSKVKRIIINDEIGNDFTLPDNIQGSVMNVASDDSENIRAYLLPSADDENLYDMYIIANGFIYAPVDSSSLFEGFSNLTEIVNPSKLLTNKTTNMSNMFKDTKIGSVNLAAWDVSKVTNMASAFENVEMTELNISTWKFNLVTDASNMFKGCNITNLVVSNLEFNGDADITSMFENATTGNLDIKLNAKAKLTAPYLFKGATINTVKLNDLSIAGAESTLTDFAINSNIVNFEGNNWDINGLSSISNLFKNSTSLETVSLKNMKLPPSEGFDLSSAFEGDNKLTTVDLSGLNGNTKVNMSNMFKDTTLLSSLNLESITGIKVTNLESFIQSSSSLETLNISKLDLSECANYTNAFVGCSALTTIYVDSTYTEPDGVTFKEETTTIVTVDAEDPQAPEPPDDGGNQEP